MRADATEGDDVGIRASYWATGGILTLLGLALGKMLLALLAPLVLGLGLFLLKAGAVLVAAMVIGLVLMAAARRRRRRAAEA